MERSIRKHLIALSTNGYKIKDAVNVLVIERNDNSFTFYLRPKPVWMKLVPIFFFIEVNVFEEQRYELNIGINYITIAICIFLQSVIILGFISAGHEFAIVVIIETILFCIVKTYGYLRLKKLIPELMQESMSQVEV